MAVDSASKRLSILNMTTAWRGSLPLPDGTIDGGDRQHLLNAYSGIAFAAPPAAGGTIMFTIIEG